MKKLLTLLAIVVVALSMTACGKKEKKELHDYKVLTELESDVTITFWHSFSDTIGKPLQRYVDQFMAENPKITVVLEQQQGGYDGLKEKVVKAIVTGETPTMLIAYPDHIASYLTGNATLSLNKFIDNDKVGLDTSDFIDSYMSENTQLGKTYGLPFNKSTELFIYNKTYFTKNNLPDPNELYDNGQWTWTKLAEIAQQIKTLNPDRGNKFYPFAYDSSSNLFITMTRQWGGQYTNNKGELLFNNEQAEAALTFYRDKHNAGLFTLPSEWEALYTTDKFLAEEAYMAVSSSAGVSKNVPIKAPYFTVGVAPIPQENADNKSVIQQGTNLSIMANSTDQERLAAWMLIKYLTSADITLDLSKETGYLPVRKSVLNGKAYQDFITSPDPENAKEVAIAAAAVAAKKQVNYSFFDPAFNTSSNVRAEVGLAIEAVLFGKDSQGKPITPKAAIQAAFDELNIKW